MWNFISSNGICAKKDSLLVYKRHVESLDKVRPFIQSQNQSRIDTNKNLSRFQNKYYASQKQKESYENKLLVNKLILIGNRTNSVNPTNNKFQRGTAFNKYQSMKKIHSENQALLERLTHARSFYQKTNSASSIEKVKYFQNMCRKNIKQPAYDELLKQEKVRQLYQASQTDQDFQNNQSTIKPTTNENYEKALQKCYCQHCKQQFDYKIIIPKLVPCKDQHIFCQLCLSESKECFIDGYKFYTSTKDLQTAPEVKLFKYCGV